MDDRILMSPTEGDKQVLASVQSGQATERFLKHIIFDTDDDCHLWAGTLDQKGYGVYSLGNGLHKNARAHRVAWLLTNGPIAEGLQIDHLCRNRRCVNPLHLEPVTSRENTLRGVGVAAKHAAKTHCPQGHPYSGNNLVMEPRGRRCRICKNAHQIKYSARLKQRGRR